MLLSWCRTLSVRFQRPDETEVAARTPGTSAPVDDLGFLDLVARAVRSAARSVGHCWQDSQTLGRGLQTVPAEKRIVVKGCLLGHARSLTLYRPTCNDSE